MVLASASPRRAQLLREAGIAFEVVPSEIDEAGIKAPCLEELPERLALAKARCVAERRPGALR